MLQVVLSVALGSTVFFTQFSHAGFFDESPETMRACMNKIGDFLELTQNHERYLIGSKGGRSCEIRMLRQKFFNKIYGVDIELFQFAINPESEFTDEFVRGLYLRIDDQQRLMAAELLDCSVEGDVAKIDVKLYEKAGWRKKYHHTLILEKSGGELKRAVMTEKEMRAFDFSDPDVIECKLGN